MITGYEIKNVNRENVLILYLNYDSEFGMDFRLRHKNGTMKEEIKSYIKNKNIRFNGDKIALSFGGIILAVLLLVGNPTTDDINLNYVNDHIIPEDIVVVVDPDINVNDNVVEDKEEIVDEIIQNKPSNNNSNQNNNTNNELSKDEVVQNKPNDSNSNQNNNLNNDVPKDDVIIENNKQESNNNSSSKPPQEEIIPLEKQVTVYRNNGSVITLSMTDYLIGVVGAEMPASFNIEALKAQAVVARTYALKKIESGGRLTDTVSTQSYKDNDELKKIWGTSFDTYYNKIKQAVLATNDIAIYYNGKYIDAVYHSTSNGKTQDAVHVWGNSIPYLVSVDSSWDKNASSYLRETSKDFNNVLSLLGVDFREDISFEILSRDDSGRVLEVRVGDNTYSGVEFRTLLGLRSADFDLSLSNGLLNITTRGFGHGVGMSQYGANGMAKSGYNYLQILRHYYTGVSIY